MRRDLVEAARRGDHDAFEILATSAGDRLYAVARLILRAAEPAEDAVQEALVRAWQELPSLRDPDRFDGAPFVTCSDAIAAGLTTYPSSFKVFTISCNLPILLRYLEAWCDHVWRRSAEVR